MPKITSGEVQLASMTWFMGVVEDNNDPEMINRVRVRCIGYHSENKSLLPTEDLPWAPFLSSTAQMSAPMVNQGDWVVGFFIDGTAAQQPVIFGSIVGKPASPANLNEGFYDPSGIHPKHIGEGTNSRHARGEIGTTDENAIAFSKSSATLRIPSADGTIFAEPASMFDARYPYNHVIETDGGHVFELDDTAGAERVHIFHKKGSFVEFHPDGSIVHRGAKDRYHVVFNNENLYAGGNMNMSVVGAINILAGGNTNISTVGDASWTVGGNLRLDVGGNFNVAVGGTTNINSAQNIQLDTSANFNVAAGGSIGVDAAGSATLYAGGQCGLGGSTVQLQGSKILSNSPIKTGGSVSKPTGGPVIIIPKTPIAIAKSATGGPTVFEILAQDDDEEKTIEEYNNILVAAGLPPIDGTPPLEGDFATPPAGGTNKDVKCGAIELLDDYTKVKVSKNFTLANFTQNGQRRLQPGPDGTPTSVILCNIVKVAENICEPILAAGIRFSITSCWRRPGDAPGSKTTSDHNYGRGVDFNLIGMSAYEGAVKIYPLVGKICKQFLLEYTSGGGPGWCHIAYGDGETKSALPLATFWNNAPHSSGRGKFIDLKPGKKL